MLRKKTLCVLIAALLSFSFFYSIGAAQDEAPTADAVAAEVTADRNGGGKEVEVADEVQVDPVNSDDRIQDRLQEIMEATGWFESPSVEVDRGVAFLHGTADTKKHQAWAEATAMKTSDVVAVVNRIAVEEQPLWNFDPAVASLKQLGREATAVLPLLVVAFVIGCLFYYLAIATAKFTRWLTANRIDSSLLRQVTGNVVAVIVFIVGMYIALRVSGLTRLAVTLLGGTGLVGLALGFAFRDIAENYLASILLSLNHPFRVGDLIEVEGAKGFVRKVTTRGTVLSTLEGNQIQMPNSTVYKGQIINYTATPLIRNEFSIGIGFDDSVTQAQEIVMTVLTEHSAVIGDPAPIVVVESLGSSTVNLRAYYWIDQGQHSPLKVKSSVIRQAKQKLTEAKITMPDEARELVFPQGVPVRIVDASASGEDPQVLDGQLLDSRDTVLNHSAREATVEEPVLDATAGEGDLATEQDEVLRATKDDETVDGEANLIA
ncbi:Small-conductance mechanosensitive channel [Rubripirellula amarantea]|uniref:Small-conductance mechanosensitive channel n=1 Tax=Rubripirellula amarantea TaxID=2527999 RepID=A0A5C5WWD5_9BACT|nr:mechanosensitive ion channel domain-containing protein [Rubripirellula amarantea]TWT54888.1 Small-conductance mechanosensitive channel [Rubripirellula amarantea]